MSKIIELNVHSPQATLREASDFLQNRRVKAVMALFSWEDEASDSLSSALISDGFTLESLLVLREIITRRINAVVEDAARE